MSCCAYTLERFGLLVGTFDVVDLLLLHTADYFNKVSFFFQSPHVKYQNWRSFRGCHAIEFVNIINGKIVYKAVADAFDLDYTDLNDII